MNIVGENGQGLAEYGMILVLAAVAVIAIVLLLGTSAGNMYTAIVNNM